MNDEFWESISKNDISSLPSIYDKTLTNLENLYCRKALVAILANNDPKTYLPLLVKDIKSEKTFSCFIKIAFNDALLYYFNTG